MNQTSNTQDDPLGFRCYSEMKMYVDDDDDDSGDDAGVPLHVVVKMAISSLPISPPDRFWRLGFSVWMRF